MKLKVAQHLGYCAGVRRAVRGAFDAPRGTCVYGEVIHNEAVVRALTERGIKTVDAPEKIDSPAVIVRSHGVGDDFYAYCARRGIEVLDFTCPFVAKTHEIVRQHFQDGFGIVIIGRKNHPEVVGINGCCDYEAQIISSPEEVGTLIPKEKLCVVVQTTFNGEVFKKIRQNIFKPECKVLEIFETICYTTLERQKEVEYLAQECDAMLILGSPKSSNTNQLYQISSRFCRSSYLISEIGQLESVLLRDDDCVGITSGASTHDELIQEVLQFYERKQ